MQGLTVRTHRLAFASVLLALPYKARFGRAVKRFTFRAHGLASQDCAMAVPTKHEVIKATRIKRVIASLRSTRQFCRSDKRAVFDLGQIQDRRAQTIVYPRSTF